MISPFILERSYDFRWYDFKGVRSKLMNFDWHLMQSFFTDVGRWIYENPVRLLIAMAGASLSHIFFHTPRIDLRPRIKRIFPKKDDASVEALQYFIVSLAGGLTAICLLRPPDIGAAFLGGFSWYATLLQITTRTKGDANG